jgi:hypothetical protein
MSVLVPARLLPSIPLAPPPLQRVPAGPGRLPIAIVAAVSFVAVALLKPWQFGAPSAPVHQFGLGSDRSSASASPRPTTDAEATAAAVQQRRSCGASAEWRLVTMESTALGDSRTLYGTLPGPASGPNDPHIPAAKLSALRLYGIGLCLPEQLRGTDSTFPIDDISVWSSAAGRPIPVRQLTVLDSDLYGLGEAYFGPPRAAMQTDTPVPTSSTAGVWRPGHYVLEIADPQLEDELWFALDFSLPPAAASASPPPG